MPLPPLRILLIQKETRSLLQVSSMWCGWRESNSHRLTPTTPSKWRVYHFTTSAFGLANFFVILNLFIRKITPGIIPNTGDSRRPDIR